MSASIKYLNVLLSLLLTLNMINTFHSREETYSAPCQTLKMELFAKVANDWQAMITNT